MVAPGEWVFFRLDAGVTRPLLVLESKPEGVTGHVFLNWEEDRVTQWCREHCFFSGSSGPAHVMVYKVIEGTGVGEWQPKPKGGKK